jgi:rhamnulokinase
MYSVGKLLDSAGDLNRELLGKLNIPETIFPEVCSEKVIGKLDNSWPDILQGVPVISGISHDTAAAFYSLAPQKNEAAVILGTWLMCGVLQEASQPIPQNVKVMGINYQYSARHASAPGLWAFNQCVEAWKKQGVFPGFAEFDAAVNASDYSGSFQAAWSDKPLLPEDVAKSLLEQGASLPQTLGDYGRALNSGMLKHLEKALESLQKSDCTIDGLVIGGGGIKNAPLMAMLKQKLTLNCRCGNAEASAWGNVLAQIHALDT